MNTNKLMPSILFVFALTMNSCAQNAEKPASSSKTTTTTTKKVTLPSHTYTYTAPSKTKTSKPSSVKTATSTTKTAEKSWEKIDMNTRRVIAPNPNQSLAQPAKSSNTTSTTGNTSINPPAQNTSSGKTKMGDGASTTINTSSTGSASQNSGSGKPKMGDGTSTSTGSSTGNNQGGAGNILNTVLGNGTGSFTEMDAASAIKEALMKGVTTGVSKVSVTDGYFKNSVIKIPFPQDAKIVETTLRSVGMGSMIDNLVLSLNRAAESAANQAGPIFLNGIKQMTITDAINIVSNQQPDAATKFLQRTTTESLVSAFKPPIQAALDKTLATKYWNDIMSNYNKIPFVQKVNPDLNDFVTRKAISGLFYMIAQEEAKIRKDPVGQGSKIIETVFGSVLKR